MKFEKPPLTYEQQVQLLRDRGMRIANIADAVSALRRLNYYRLAAYWYPFYSGDPKGHQFRDGASFDDVLAIYEFDRRLRLRVTDAIERFEIALRAKFAYVLAHRHDPWAYERPSLFSDLQRHTSRLGSLDRELARSDETFIQHYQATYSDPQRPPIWMACEVMSLGLLSGFYDSLKQRQDRNAIASDFGLDETVLRSFAHHITVIRNICAHHGRLWNRQFVLTMRLPKKAPAELLSSLHPAAPRKLYNTLAMLGYLLRSVSSDAGWREQLMSLFDEYPVVDTQAMGFPAGWQERAIWKA